MKEAQNIVTKNHENHVGRQKQTPKDLKKGLFQNFNLLRSNQRFLRYVILEF